MKTKLCIVRTIALSFLALIQSAIGQLTSPIPYQPIDTSTLSTNPTYSVGMMTVTNVFTNQGYLSQRSNSVSVGDSFPIAFGKLNTFMWQVDEWAQTNNFGGGGGFSSNAIANYDGFGTNITLFGDTDINGTNLVINYDPGIVSSIGLIPSMTSATTPSGTASASAFMTGHDPYYAFSTNAGVNWNANGGGTNWLQYQFPSSVTVGSNSFAFNFAGSGTTVYLYDSSDGTTWNLIYKYAVGSSSPFSTNFTPVTATYFRWAFSGSVITVLSGDQLYGSSSPVPANVMTSVPELKIESPNGVIIDGPLTVQGFPISGSSMIAQTFSQLYISGATGTATSYNGVMQGVGSGIPIYTNTATGYALLCPGQYSYNSYLYEMQTFMLTTNLTPTAFTNPPAYYSWNLLGYYTPLFSSPNCPIVISAQALGITTNCTVTISGVNHTASFTNGILMGFQ